MKLLLVSITIAILSGCYSVEPEKTGLEGQLIPSFKLLLPDSITQIDTKDIPVGKPCVLFYYGPHCPYSRAQMKEMIQNMAIMKNIQFYVITGWPFIEMKNFYVSYQLNKYTNVITGLDYTHFFENYFKVTGVPFTAIYDKDKKLNSAFDGKIFTKQIIKALK